MPAALDIVALRSFVAIADCGGYHHAAAALHLSQSTVSQHVHKLETAVGRSLLQRQGRVMRLTADGEAFLAQTRILLEHHDQMLRRLGAAEVATIVVGTTEHGADHLLPYVTRAFAARLPEVQVRFRIDRGARLNDGLDRGSIDVAVLLGAAHENSVHATDLSLNWYAAADWTPPPHRAPIPLVAIDDPCTIRRKAIRTLADARRTYTIVAEAGYLAGVTNAVRAGIGVALLAEPGDVPDGLQLRDDLPSATPEPLHVRARKGVSADLEAIVTAAVREALVLC